MSSSSTVGSSDTYEASPAGRPDKVPSSLRVPAAVSVPLSSFHGFALKKSNRSWQLRYCVVWNRTLVYYSSPKDQTPRGTLDLRTCSGVAMGGPDGCGFRLTFPWKEYLFKAKNEKESVDGLCTSIVSVISDVQVDKAKAMQQRAAYLKASVRFAEAMEIQTLNESAKRDVVSPGGFSHDAELDEDLAEMDRIRAFKERHKQSLLVRLQVETQQLTSSDSVGETGADPVSPKPNAVRQRAISSYSPAKWMVVRSQYAMHVGAEYVSSNLSKESSLFKFVTGKKDNHIRYFAINADQTAVSWGSKAGKVVAQPEKTIQISEIIGLEFGMRPELVAKRKLDASSVGCCFTIYTAERSVEIMCPSKEECDAWVLGMQYLWKRSRPDHRIGLLTPGMMVWKRKRWELEEKAMKRKMRYAELFSELVRGSAMLQ